MKLREPIALYGLNRTPMGKLGGMLAKFEPYELLAATFRETLKSIPTPAPEDVLTGCVRNGIGNIARVAALAAGVDESVPAATIDRQCASSLETLAIAAAKINAGLADQLLIGGVESASRAPWMFEKTSRPYSYAEPRALRIRMATEEVGDPPMGETAEILADEFSITREDMDAFACESHRRAAEAAGQFADESAAAGAALLAKADSIVDECVRPDTSIDKLAKLRPVFRRDGRVTAGNSCPLNDGAASCLAVSKGTAQKIGAPDAWITGVSTVGLAPKRMGLGPAIAIPRLLKEQGIAIEDVDLVEINEAFAAQILAALRKMEQDGVAISRDRLNIFGGAIALGHPLGATGLRLVVTLVNALRVRGANRGIAALCVGGGQGMALMLERELSDN
ncbi:thiolase family protein [bacterium]|nr:thiolase family protein [bacterium]